METKVTVIVPVYNTSKYINKCVDSILEQTYKALEIILVDDGSTDGSSHICDEYAQKDPRIKVIHKKNGGLSSARNAGLDHSTGEYIGFVDSDDYIEPHMYESLLCAIKHANAELCICGFQYVDEEGKLQPAPASSPIKTETLIKADIYEKLFGDAYYYYVIACNKLYHSKLFAALRFPEGRVHEDEFIAHHVFSLCETVATISTPLYFYVQRDGSIMNAAFNIKRLDACWAFIDRWRFFRKKGLVLYARKALRQSYGVLLRGIDVLDVAAYKNAINPIFIRVFLYLARSLDLRALKLLLHYVKSRLHRSKTYQFASKTRLHFRCLPARLAGRPVAFLLATPEHGNLGDHAIVYAEKKMLKENAAFSVVEVTNSEYFSWRNWLPSFIKTGDRIIIDGGGNLGTLWPQEDDKITDIVERFSENEIFIFPQTCYYDSSDAGVQRMHRNYGVYKAAKHLHIMVRDKKSYEYMSEHFPQVSIILVPDIVLSIKNASSHTYERNGVLLCFRSDKEKVVPNAILVAIKKHLEEIKEPYIETSMLVNRRVCARTRDKELFNKWREFSRAELVITDRLHAMIFAAITGTPCIAVDNVSKKVSGSYALIKALDYICCLSNVEDILKNIDRMRMQYGKFDFMYPEKDIIGILRDSSISIL